MNTKKMILTFGINADERIMLMNGIKRIPNVLIKNIEHTMLDMKLKDIIEGTSEKVEKVDKNIKKEYLNEKVILFYNIDDNELNSIIRNIKNTKDFNPILAVVTSTSIGWDFNYLLEHLIEEREWFAKNRE